MQPINFKPLLTSNRQGGLYFGCFEIWFTRMEYKVKVFNNNQFKAEMAYVWFGGLETGKLSFRILWYGWWPTPRPKQPAISQDCQSESAQVEANLSVNLLVRLHTQKPAWSPSCQRRRRKRRSRRYTRAAVSGEKMSSWISFLPGVTGASHTRGGDYWGRDQATQEVEPGLKIFLFRW